MESVRDFLPHLSEVTISPEAVEKLASHPRLHRRPSWNGFHYRAPGAEETANYLLAQDAIAFCFWGDPPWEVEYRGRHFRGYHALVAALRRSIEVGCPLPDPGYLRELTLDDLSFILRGEGELKLLRERLECLREVGEVLTRQFGGSFLRAVEEADGRVSSLLELVVSSFPSFDDRAFVEGREVVFHKRAQLLIADLHGALGDALPLEGLEELTAFADYQLPALLRDRGVLGYSPSLAARVDAGEELPAGSREEVEIRAATVWAVEMLREALSRRGVVLRSFEVDWLLWDWSQEEPPSRPHHRTVTTKY